MSDQFYSVPEIQRLTGGKSRSTIWRWSRAGILPKPHRIGPNSVGYLKSDIDSWFSKFQGEK